MQKYKIFSELAECCSKNIFGLVGKVADTFVVREIKCIFAKLN